MNFYALNRYLIRWPVPCALRHLRDGIGYALTRGHLPKNGVGTVQMGSWSNGNEELAPVGAGA